MSAIEAERGHVVLAQLEMDGRRARYDGALQQPAQQLARDAAPLVLRDHRHKHEVRTLVAEGHDREADNAIVITADDRHGSAICHQFADAARPVLPTQSGLDQVA